MDLLIDDQRTFCECIAKTYAVGMRLLRCRGIGRLFIDFDLGESKTGLDILKDGFKENILPDFIQLVTMNPAGREQMGNYLKDYCGYTNIARDAVNFIKEQTKPAQILRRTNNGKGKNILHEG
jgi:hypothetical protein